MGFPSPASDYTEDRLSLDEHLIEHRESTFFVTATGSMPDFGIHNGDLMVVDRAIDPVDQSIVVAVIDGDFTVRQLRYTPEGIVLRAASDGSEDIHIGNDQNLSVWGVVRWSIHRV
jgi:DNA polymerase V